MGRSYVEWMKSWVKSDRCPRLSIRVTYFFVETETLDGALGGTYD